MTNDDTTSTGGPDSRFLAAIAAAEQAHKASRCRCGCKARIVGSDGPDLALLEAGWRCAEAIDHAVFSNVESDALIELVLKALTRYRTVRSPK